MHPQLEKVIAARPICLNLLYVNVTEIKSEKVNEVQHKYQVIELMLGNTD